MFTSFGKKTLIGIPGLVDGCILNIWSKICFPLLQFYLNLSLLVAYHKKMTSLWYSIKWIIICKILKFLNNLELSYIPIQIFYLQRKCKNCSLNLEVR